MTSSSVSLLLIEENEQEELLRMFMPYLDELVTKSNGALVIDMNRELNLLASYWRDATRFPYFIVTPNKEILGFVLVNDYCEKESRVPRFAIAEFYLKPEFRMKGSGSKAARLAFEQHKGYWEVRVQNFNHAGKQFWSNVVAEFTSGDFAELSTDAATYFLFKNQQAG